MSPAFHILNQAKMINTDCINLSIDLLIDSLDASRIGPRQLGITRDKYFTLYGLWLIHLLGLIARFVNGATSQDLVKTHTDNTNLLYTLSPEDDYRYCIYLARLYGWFRSPKLLQENLELILNCKLSKKKFRGPSLYDINSLLLETKIVLDDQLLSYVSLNLCCSAIYTPLSLEDYFSLQNLVSSVVPISIREFGSSSFWLSSNNPPKSMIAKTYGDSLIENHFACSFPMSVKQHGIQEQLIEYHPNIYYINKSLYKYIPYNAFIADNSSVTFFYWPLIKRAIVNSLCTLLHFNVSRVIIIYTSSTTPNQNIVGDDIISSMYWQDIFRIARDLSALYHVVIRPTVNCNRYFNTELSGLDQIHNVNVDHDRALTPSLCGPVIITSFSTYIVESALSFVRVYAYFPNYRPNSRLNVAGRKFFDTSKLSSLTYQCPDKLVNHLKTVCTHPFSDMLNQIIIKISLFRAIIYKSSL